MVVNAEYGEFVQDFPQIAGSALYQNPLPVELVEPVDISNAVVYLASDDGRYVTGSTMTVDAGYLNRGVQRY